MSTPMDPFIAARVRELRLWHWRNALDASRERGYIERQRADVSIYTKVQLQNAKSRYNVHMLAVQTLNSFFLLGDTAERDAGVTVAELPDPSGFEPTQV